VVADARAGLGRDETVHDDMERCRGDGGTRSYAGLGAR
jgi:hypothetical protein